MSVEISIDKVEQVAYIDGVKYSLYEIPEEYQEQVIELVTKDVPNVLKNRQVTSVDVVSSRPENIKVKYEVPTPKDNGITLEQLGEIRYVVSGLEDGYNVLVNSYLKEFREIKDIVKGEQLRVNTGFKFTTINGLKEFVKEYPTPQEYFRYLLSKGIPTFKDSDYVIVENDDVNLSVKNSYGYVRVGDKIVSNILCVRNVLLFDKLGLEVYLPTISLGKIQFGFIGIYNYAKGDFKELEELLLSRLLHDYAINGNKKYQGSADILTTLGMPKVAISTMLMNSIVSFDTGSCVVNRDVSTNMIDDYCFTEDRDIMSYYRDNNTVFLKALNGISSTIRITLLEKIGITPSEIELGMSDKDFIEFLENNCDDATFDLIQPICNSIIIEHGMQGNDFNVGKQELYKVVMSTRDLDELIKTKFVGSGKDYKEVCSAFKKFAETDESFIKLIPECKGIDEDYEYYKEKYNKKKTGYLYITDVIEGLDYHNTNNAHVYLIGLYREGRIPEDELKIDIALLEKNNIPKGYEVFMCSMGEYLNNCCSRLASNTHRENEHQYIINATVSDDLMRLEPKPGFKSIQVNSLFGTLLDSSHSLIGQLLKQDKDAINDFVNMCEGTLNIYKYINRTFKNLVEFRNFYHQGIKDLRSKSGWEIEDFEDIDDVVRSAFNSESKSIKQSDFSSEWKTLYHYIKQYNSKTPFEPQHYKVFKSFTEYLPADVRCPLSLVVNNLYPKPLLARDTVTTSEFKFINSANIKDMKHFIAVYEAIVFDRFNKEIVTELNGVVYFVDMNTMEYTEVSKEELMSRERIVYRDIAGRIMVADF